MRLRTLFAVLLAAVLIAMLAAVVLVVDVFDGREKDQAAAQQTASADLWARMLTARMEAHQRLLTSIAQGMHSSLLDNPAVLDALMQQDGSMLRLFESLHVALPNGSVTHHGQVGAQVEIDSSGRDGLRRTVTEGKPTVTYLQSEADAEHLRVLLSVPLRHAQGQVSGALAAIVKLPIAALLPELEGIAQNVQYMLVSNDGVVLVHSEPSLRWQNIKVVMGAYWPQWQELSKPSTANADTRQWSHMLATRVGLPLPQWQAVVLRDASNDAVFQQLSARWWGGLSLLGILIALLAGLLLGQYLGLWRRPVGSAHLLAQDANSSEAGGDLTPAMALEGEGEPLLSAQAQAMAMLEAMPSVLFLEQDGQVRMATSQLAVVLGDVFAGEEFVAIARLFDDTQALQRIRTELVSQGSYEGLVTLKKRDGDTVQLDAFAWSPSSLSSATVWQLRLPWRAQKSAPLPGDPQAWHDPLTGLPNREAFVWGLQSWTSGCMAAQQTPLSVNLNGSAPMPSKGCVLFADVDHLGMINETTSREMGDKVLRQVGRLIASYTQPLGDVARLGGDEFAVLLPGISLAHAQGLAQALCDALWRWQPSWGGERQWVSISIGVVAADPLRHAANDVLRAADMACYEAKRRGRCQVAVGHVARIQSDS